jgi:hypothetical protein
VTDAAPLFGCCLSTVLLPRCINESIGVVARVARGVLRAISRKNPRDCGAPDWQCGIFCFQGRNASQQATQQVGASPMSPPLAAARATNAAGF